MPALLDPDVVVPASWRGDRPAAVFNPALLREDAGWIAAYRVVGSDGRRRIALCRLDGQFRAAAGTVTPWSDLVEFGARELSPRAREWFADPRLYRWAGRVFLYWNTGWHEPRNHQFLQEIDGPSLRPVGVPAELELAGEAARPLEKNWLFFGADGERLIYSPQPLRIYEVDTANRTRIAGPPVAGRAWQPRFETHGGLRGGCPPVQVDGQWFAICHSVGGADGSYRYEPWVIRFAAAPGHPLTGYPAAPLPLPNPFGGGRRGAKLNPAVGEVIYPSSADFRAGAWTIGYGINDEHAAIAVLPHEVLLSCLAASP